MSYDTRGNVTSLGSLSFIYDMTDQPRSVSGDALGSYAYDGNLKRVKSVVNGETIYNIYSQSGRLVAVDKLTEGKTTAYIKGAKGTLARISDDGSASNITYLHKNHLGSSLAGTDESGAIKWRRTYSPFGIEISTDDAANDNEAGYTGHLKDKATGLNYMQARYYDPVIGRFLSVDPVGFHDTMLPGQFNQYAYTWNDPINANDPDGELLNFVIGGVVGFGLDVAIQMATNPGGDIDFRQAAISGAAGAVGAGIGAKVAQGFSALGKSTSLAHGAHQVAAGAAVNTAAGVANNLTDGNAQTKALDGAGLNAAVGGLGAAAGTAVSNGLSAAGTGLSSSAGTTFARGVSKGLPDMVSNLTTQTPNMDFDDNADFDENDKEDDEERGG